MSLLILFQQPVAGGTTYTRTATDSLTSSESITRVVTLLRATTEAPTTSDTSTRLQVLARSTTDARTSADVATRLVVLARSATEATSAADVSVRVVILARSATDTRTECGYRNPPSDADALDERRLDDFGCRDARHDAHQERNR
jgi:hypothetical protein